MEHFLLQHLLVWTCHYAMSCHLLMYKWKAMVKDVGNQGDWLDNLFDVFAGLLLVCSNWKAMAKGVWNQDDWSDKWSKHKHGEGAKVVYVVACRFCCSLTGYCWIRRMSPAAKQLQQSQFFQWHNPSMQIIMEEEAGHEKSMQDFTWVNCTISGSPCKELDLSKYKIELPSIWVLHNWCFLGSSFCCGQQQFQSWNCFNDHGKKNWFHPHDFPRSGWHSGSRRWDYKVWWGSVVSVIKFYIYIYIIFIKKLPIKTSK